MQFAGFSDSKILGDLHLYRSNDARLEEVEGGLNPIQVIGLVG